MNKERYFIITNGAEQLNDFLKKLEDYGIEYETDYEMSNGTVFVVVYYKED